MKRFIAGLLLAASCASGQKSDAPKPDSSTGALRGFVKLDPAVREKGPCKGRLLMTWMTSEEAELDKAHKVSMQQEVEVLLRYRVVGDVDLCAPDAAAPYVLRVPPGRVLPNAVLDVDRLFSRALLRGDAPGTRLGQATEPVDVPAGGTANLDVTLTRAEEAWDMSTACTGERFTHFVVDAPEVAGTVGNPTARGFCAYLPRSYDASPSRKYPVIFLLPGFTGTHIARFKGSKVHEIADRLSTETGLEAILVGVDTSTRLGSTYFEDTALHGKWESFATRMVKEVEARFRVIPSSSAHAVAGQSTGGLNALSLGIRHPELFGVVVSAAPDPPDLAVGMLEKDGVHFQKWLQRWTVLEDAAGADGQIVSWAADWSPSSHARGFDWPIDLTTGAIIPDVWKRWLAHSPAELIKDPRVRDRIRVLDGKLLLWAGAHDEFGLNHGARAIAEQLNAAGIRTEYVEDEGTHGMTAERLAQQLRWALQHLDGPRP